MYVICMQTMQFRITVTSFANNMLTTPFCGATESTLRTTVVRIS